MFQQSNSEMYGAIKDIHIIAGDMIITVSIREEHYQKQKKGKAKIQVENINLIQVKAERG